jgi:hypothetical protein
MHQSETEASELHTYTRSRSISLKCPRPLNRIQEPYFAITACGYLLPIQWKVISESVRVDEAMNAGTKLRQHGTHCVVKATESCRQTRGRWRQSLDRLQHLMISGVATLRSTLWTTESVRPKPSTSGAGRLTSFQGAPVEIR